MEQGPEMKDVSPEAGSAPVIQDGACPQPAEELSNPEKTPFPDVAMETATAEDCSEPALRIETCAEDGHAGRKRPREDADEVAEPRAACDVPESGNGSLRGVGCVVSAPATQPATAGSTGGQHAAAPPTAATLAPDSAVRPTMGGVGGAGPPPFLPMLPMMLMGMGMPIFPGIGPGARAPLMPPAFMPALCQLLLVYVQRVKQLTGQPQQQHPDDPGAAEPHSTAPDTSPAAPGQSPPDDGAPPAAAPPPPDQRAAAKPAAALADHRPEQRPEPQQPPAVVAVSQLQEFGIPVPSLLQAAAHLMVVGALSPVQYQEVQAKLGPIAAQEGQAALAADGGASVAAAAVAAAAAAVRATGPAATAAAGTLGASHVAPAAASVLTPAAAAALAAAGGSGLLQPAASAPAVAGAPGALAKATPVVPGFTAKVDPAQRQPPEASAAEPGLLPTVSWPGRGGAQAPFRLGLGRRLFCAVADQLPTSTELDCILPPMYGFSGVLYRMKDSAEVGAALWDGAVVRDLGPYTSAQDARQSVVMSIKLLAAANAAAPQPSGPAYTSGGALPGAPSLRSGPSVRSGGLRAAAVAAGAAAPAPLGGGARREPPPSGPMRDGVAGLGGHGDGLGRGGSRGVKANGRSGLGLGLPAVGAPGSGPGLPGAGPSGVGPDPAEADVLEAADQLLKLRSEGSGRIHMSNSPEPLPVVVAPAAAGVTALGGLVGAELGAPPLPPAVAAQLVAAPGKQRSLSALATADDPIILSPGLTAAAPTGVGLAGLQHLADAGVSSGGGGKSSRTGSGSGRSGGAVAADEPQGPTVTGRLAIRTPSSLSQARQPPAGPLAASPRHLGSLHVRAFAAAAANPTLPEAAGARAPTPSWAQQEHQRRDVAPVVDLTMTDVDTRSSVQQSPRGTNRMTPLVLKPGGGASQVGSEAAALVALISSGRLQDMDRAELEALVAGSSGPALLAALQSLPQDLVAAATAAESGAGGHAMEADKGERPGQAGAAPSQRQQQQSVELRRGPGWDDGDGQPAGGSAGLPRRGRAEAVGAADDDGPQRGLVGASAADDGVLVLGGVGGGALQLPLAVDGKDGLRGAAPRDLLDGADDAAAGAARRHHATDQEALLLQQLQELAGQAHAQRQGAAGPRQRPLHPEPPMRGPPGPGPGGPWAAPPQGRVVVPAGLSSVGRGGVDPRDEAMDAYTSAVAAAVQQQHQQQHQQQQRHLHQQLQLQQHLAAGRRDGAGAAGGRGPRGRPGMPERPLSSGGLGGTHAGMPGAVVMLGGGPRGGDGASPLLIGHRGGDMLGLPLGLDGGGSGAMPRFSGPLHGMAAAAARGRFSPYDSPNAEHHHQHQQQLSEPAEQLLQRLQGGRAGGTLWLQQPGPGGDGRRMAAPMYGRPPGAAVGGGGGGGGGGSLSAHDGTGIYTTSGRTSSQPTYGASYSTHGSRGRDVSGGAAGEAAFAGPSSSHGPFDRLGGISSSGAKGLGGLGSVMPLLGSGLSGLPPAGGVAPADDSPSGSGSGGGAARLGGPGGELDAATGADPALKRQRSGVTREFSAVTNLVGLGLQEALAIVRQRQGPHS